MLLYFTVLSCTVVVGEYVGKHIAELYCTVMYCSMMLSCTVLSCIVVVVGYVGSHVAKLYCTILYNSISRVWR